MALIQVNRHTVTTGNEVQNVTLTGINTTDTYVLFLTNVTVTNAGICDMYLTKSGSQDTTTDFGVSWLLLRTDSAFQEFGNAIGNQNVMRFTDGMGTGNAGKLNAVVYMYNLQSSQRKIFNMNVSSYTASSQLYGYQQGATKNTTDACDGVLINTNSSGGGFADGSDFILYKEV